MKTFFSTAFLLSILQLSFAGSTDAITCDSVAIKGFYHLIASSSVNVVLVNSRTHFAYIEGTSGAIASVKVRQEGATIYISRTGLLVKGRVLVYLPAFLLRSIEANDGAKVCSYDAVKGDTLILIASGQSSIRIMADANIVHSVSDGNGEVQLFETCNYSFAQTDENGVSFIELRKKGYKESF
ncbi:MAG TPA: DUF2807 domain-containing protein [Chitinophagales bacterium]|nr:DUF2807 domain-containing protein [Chitinophagales bacterium]